MPMGYDQGACKEHIVDSVSKHDSPHSDRQWDAVVAAAWVALIYATVPLVRTFQGWFDKRFDKVWITAFVLVALVSIVAVVGTRLKRGARRISAADTVWLGAVAAVAGWLTWQLRDRPEEAIHLLEYGFLTVFIYRAIRPRETDAAVVGAAVLLTTLLGAVDEIIQWITPLRYWDLRDVGLNAVAALLVAVAIWRLDPGPWRRPAADSVRRMMRIGAAFTILLVLCLANTPDRVSWYSSRVPGLGFLAHPTNEMAEYGHLLVIPRLGEFKTRLTLPELRAEDRLRSAEVATAIERYPDHAYRQFVSDHQGFRDPLLYEARIHLFSRDHHLNLARQEKPDSAKNVDHLTRAFRENRILEDFYPNTLRHTNLVLTEEQRRELETGQDADRSFISKVGSHLITRWSESRLRWSLLALAAVLLTLDILLGIQSRLTEVSK